MGFFDDAVGAIGHAASSVVGGLGGGAASLFMGGLPGLGAAALGGLAGNAGEALGIGGGGAASPNRGEPRAGGAAPDKANFELGWDPSGAQAIGQQAFGVGAQAAGMNDTAADTRTQALAADRRGTPGVDQTQANAQLAQSNAQGD